jgi:hypothetical protein
VPTSGDGTFAFIPIAPATYSVSVEAAGFKKFVQQDIRVFANDRVGLPPIMLALGELGESVSVEANAVQLQTISADRSGVVLGNQLLDLAVNGRSFVSLLLLTPGVTADAGQGSLPSVGGTRPETTNMTVDGMTTIDYGNNQINILRIPVDAIGEFKLVTNGQESVFGRGSGGQVSMVTKGGGHDFHGDAYWFNRQTGFNANTWINNATGVKMQPSRQTTYGVSLGGPVYIPGKVNRNKDKLFFFALVEPQAQALANPAVYQTVPTVKARTGDFSDSVLSNGQVVSVIDPSSKAPFPNNVIPSSRFNSDGRNLLNFFPLPNVTGQPSYNYINTSLTENMPTHDEVIRVDYNVSKNWRLFFRGVDNNLSGVTYGTNNTYPGYLGNSNNIGIGKLLLPYWGFSVMGNLTTIISPTMANEFISGSTRNAIPCNLGDDSYLRSKVGITFTPLYPNADVLQMIPGFSFAGVPNGPSVNWNGIPFYNRNPVWDVTDNFSKVFPKHLLKIGVYYNNAFKMQTAYTRSEGVAAFDTDPANPGDTNWAYANALLGNFDSFTQASDRLTSHMRSTNTEWYVQDTWNIRPNLVLSYGLRFILNPPVYDEYNQVSSFNLKSYDSAQAVKLYQPVMVGGVRSALNPVTGQTAPAVLIGAIVPGVGNPFDGMVIAGQNGYPRGLINSRGLHYAPRIGLAWMPAGPGGKWVVRAGGAVAYERERFDTLNSEDNYPPLSLLPTVYYGNLATLSSSGGNLFPSTAGGSELNGQVPTVYNYNLTVQREMPLKAMLDVAYVGSLTRHEVSAWLRNDVPFGADWLPQYQDPTLGSPQFNGTTTLPVNFLRPYIGYGAINLYGNSASANYNALQVGVRRSVGRLQVGAAYTWSKALDIADGYSTTVNPLNARMANYGPAGFDRRQVLVFNYIYNLPSITKALGLNSKVSRGFLDDWQISGITTMSSGSPITPSYSLNGVSSALLDREITGSDTEAPRVVLTGDPMLSHGDRSVYSWFNTGVFQPAVKGSTGWDSARNPMTGPGTNNFNISVFKKISLGQENVRFVQLRLEAYNALNHAQFSGVNSSAVFNAAGQLVNLPSAVGGAGGQLGFGAVNGSRAARVVQIAAKLYF